MTEKRKLMNDYDIDIQNSLLYNETVNYKMRNYKFV